MKQIFLLRKYESRLGNDQTDLETPERPRKE